MFDDAGQADRLSCLLPDFPGYVVSNGARGADLQVQATPGSNTQVQVGLFRYLTATFPDSIAKIGYLTGNIATTINNKSQYQEAAASSASRPSTTTGTTRSASRPGRRSPRRIKDKGVKGLYYVGEPINLGKLLDALAQIDYKLDWVAGGRQPVRPER